MDGILEIEMGRQRCEIVGVVVHVVPVEQVWLEPLPAPVVRDDAVTVLHEEQHLAVPVVGRRAASRG